MKKTIVFLEVREPKKNDLNCGRNLQKEGFIGCSNEYKVEYVANYGLRVSTVHKYPIPEARVYDKYLVIPEIGKNVKAINPNYLINLFVYVISKK